MNSFDNSDQQDFDKILESTERINTTVEQNTGILSKIQDGVGAVGNGIANIYRNNKEDYGINMPQVRQNVATMSGGPLAAVINDALANVGLDMGSIIKNSIGNLIDRFHGHSDNFEAGDIAAGFEPVMKQQIAQGNEQIGIAKQHIQEDKQDTNRKIANDNANTERIIRKMDDLSIELTGSQSGRTGKRGAGIGGGGGGGLHGGNVRNVQVLGGGSAGTSSTQSLNQITALLNAILNGQQQLNGIFVDPDADKGGWFSIIKEFGGMWKGIKFWMNGRYARDIPRSQNPLETMTNALLKIYEWERIGIDLSRRQLNELIKASGGQQQTYFGHEGALKTYLKKKTNELKNAIDSKYGADSFTGKSLKGIVNAAAFFAKFTDEDFKDDRFAQAHNALRSMGRRKNQMEGKINTFDEYQTRQYLDTLGMYGTAPEIDQSINDLFSKQSLERQKLFEDISSNSNVLDQLDAFNKINKNAVGPGRDEAVKKAYKNLVQTIKLEQENLGFNGLHTDPLKVTIPKKAKQNGEYTIDEILEDPMNEILQNEVVELYKLEQELATQEEFLKKTGHYNTNTERSVDELKKSIGIIKKNQTDRLTSGKTHARIGDTVIPVTIINPSKRIASQLRQRIGSGVSDQSMAFSNNVIVGLNRLADLLGGNGISLAEELVMALEASKNGIAVRNIHDENYNKDDVNSGVELLDEINAERHNNGTFDSVGIANAITAADQNTNLKNLRGEYTVEGEELEAQKQQAEYQRKMLELLSKKGVLTERGDGKGSGWLSLLTNLLGGGVLNIAKNIAILAGAAYSLDKLLTGWSDENGKGEGKKWKNALDYILDNKSTTAATVAAVTQNKKLATTFDTIDYLRRKDDVNGTGRAVNQGEAAAMEWLTPFGLGGIGLNISTIAGDAVENMTGSSAAGDLTANAGRMAVNAASGKFVDAIGSKGLQFAGTAMEKGALGLTHLGSHIGNSSFVNSLFNTGNKVNAFAKSGALKAAGPWLQAATGAWDAYNRQKNGDYLGAEIAGGGAGASILAFYAFGGPAAWIVGGLTLAALYWNDKENEKYVDDMNCAFTDNDFLRTEDNAEQIQKIMADKEMPDLKKAIKIGTMYRESYQGSTRKYTLEQAFNDPDFMSRFEKEIKKEEKDAESRGLNGAQAKKYSEFVAIKYYDYYKREQEKFEKLKNLQEQCQNALKDSKFTSEYHKEIESITDGVNAGKFTQEDAIRELASLHDAYNQFNNMLHLRDEGEISAKSLLDTYADYANTDSPLQSDNELKEIIDEFLTGKKDPVELEYKLREWKTKREQHAIEYQKSVEKENTQSKKFAGGASINDRIVGLDTDGQPFEMGEAGKEYLIPANTSEQGTETLDKIAKSLVKKTGKKFGSYATGSEVTPSGSVTSLTSNGIGDFTTQLSQSMSPYLDQIGISNYGLNASVNGDNKFLDELKTSTADAVKDVTDNQEKAIELFTDLTSEIQGPVKDIAKTVKNISKDTKNVVQQNEERDINSIINGNIQQSSSQPQSQTDVYKRDESGKIVKDENGNPVIDQDKVKKIEKFREDFLKEQDNKKKEGDVFDIAYYDDEQKFQEELAKVGNEKRKKQLIEGRARVLDARATTGNTYEQDEEFSGPKIDKDLLQFRKDFVGPELPDEERAKLEQEKSLAETAKEVQEQEAGEIDIDSYPDDTLLDDIPGLAKHEGSSLDFLRPSAKVGEEVEGEETFLDEDGKRTQVVNETGKSAAGSQNVTYTEKNVGDIFKELGISGLNESIPDPYDRLAYIDKIQSDENYKKYHSYAQNVAAVHGNDFHTYFGQFMYGKKNAGTQEMADGMTANNREAVLKRIYANLPEDMPKEQKAIILESASMSWGHYSDKGMTSKNAHEYSDALRGINAVENPFDWKKWSPYDVRSGDIRPNGKTYSKNANRRQREIEEDTLEYEKVHGKVYEPTDNNVDETSTTPAEAAIEAVNSNQYKGSDELLDDVADQVSKPEVGSEVEGTPEANTVVNADKKQGVIQDQAKAQAKQNQDDLIFKQYRDQIDDALISIRGTGTGVNTQFVALSDRDYNRNINELGTGHYFDVGGEWYNKLSKEGKQKFQNMYADAYNTGIKTNVKGSDLVDQISKSNSENPEVIELEKYTRELLSKNPKILKAGLYNGDKAPKEVHEFWTQRNSKYNELIDKYGIDTPEKRKALLVRSGSIIWNEYNKNIGKQDSDVIVSDTQKEVTKTPVEIAKDVISEINTPIVDNVNVNKPQETVTSVVSTPTQVAKEITTPVTGTEVEGDVQTNPINVSDQTTGQIKEAGSREVSVTTIPQQQVQDIDGVIKINEKDLYKRWTPLRSRITNGYIGIHDNISGHGFDVIVDDKDPNKIIGAKLDSNTGRKLVKNGVTVDSYLREYDESQYERDDKTGLYHKKQENVVSTPTQVAKEITTPVTGTEVEGTTQINPIDVSSTTSGQIKDTGTRQAGTYYWDPASGGLTTEDPEKSGKTPFERALKHKKFLDQVEALKNDPNNEGNKTIQKVASDIQREFADGGISTSDINSDTENLSGFTSQRIANEAKGLFNCDDENVSKYVRSEYESINEDIVPGQHPWLHYPNFMRQDINALYKMGKIPGKYFINQILNEHANPYRGKMSMDEYLDILVKEYGEDNLRRLQTRFMNHDTSLSQWEDYVWRHWAKKDMTEKGLKDLIPDMTLGTGRKAFKENFDVVNSYLHNKNSTEIEKTEGGLSLKKKKFEAKTYFSDGGLSEGYSSVPVHEGNTLWGEGKSGLGGAEFKLAMDNGSSAFLPVSSREGTLTSKVKKYITEGVKNGGKVEGPKQLATGTIMGTDSKIDSSARALAQELISDVRFSDGGISDSTPEFGGAPRAASLNTQGIREATSAESTEHAINGLREEIASNTQNVIASNTTMKSMVSKGGSVVNHNTTINNNPDTHYLQAMGLAHSNPNVVP